MAMKSFGSVPAPAERRFNYMKHGRAVVAALVSLCWLGAETLRATACEIKIPPPILTNGMVCGTALDIEEPLADGEITLIDGVGRVVATTTADANGTFKFPPVAEGLYRFGLAGFHDTANLIRV